MSRRGSSVSLDAKRSKAREHRGAARRRLARRCVGRRRGILIRLLPARRLRRGRRALFELLGEPDEKSFGAADVAEPIQLFVLNHFADELRTMLAEPGEGLVNIV